jgi:hypothetical protein
MSDETSPMLFDLPPAEAMAKPTSADPKRGARLREANRAQLAWGRIDLDSQLPEDHPARAIYAFIERMDLAALYTPIGARDDVAGAPAIDPKILSGCGCTAPTRAKVVSRRGVRLVLGGRF